LQLREEMLPFLRLSEVVGLNRADLSETGLRVVILGVAEKRVALLVDELVGQESTVVKPLGTYFQGSATVAGATITGDGRVRLVLDPAGLLIQANRQASCAFA
jgi:two-component system chemotaxis sensor kinase CheA